LQLLPITVKIIYETGYCKIIPIYIPIVTVYLTFTMELLIQVLINYCLVTTPNASVLINASPLLPRFLVIFSARIGLQTNET